MVIFRHNTSLEVLTGKYAPTHMRKIDEHDRMRKRKCQNVVTYQEQYAKSSKGWNGGGKRGSGANRKQRRKWREQQRQRRRCGEQIRDRPSSDAAVLKSAMRRCERRTELDSKVGRAEINSNGDTLWGA